MFDPVPDPVEFLERRLLHLPVAEFALDGFLPMRVTLPDEHDGVIVATPPTAVSVATEESATLQSNVSPGVAGVISAVAVAVVAAEIERGAEVTSMLPPRRSSPSA